MEQKRKRGRPRKINNITHKDREKETKKKDENIVLFLALSDTEDNPDINGEDSQFTETNTKQNGLSEKDDTSSESSENLYTKNQYTISTLIAEIKKRDSIILSLKKKQYNKYNNYTETNPISIDYKHISLSNADGDTIKPKKTDKLCWWCNCSFDTLPVYIPIFYKKGVFYVIGNCCSFECAASYNIIRLNDHGCTSRHSLLATLKYKITGNISPIKFAKSPEQLIDKGGTQSYEDYKKHLTYISNNFIINLPPMIPLIHNV